MGVFEQPIDHELLLEVVHHNQKKLDRGGEVYSFCFQGQEIYDFFLDETMRFVVNPTDYYGFENIQSAVKGYLDDMGYK